MDDVTATDITFTDLEMLVAFARTEHFGHTAAELGVSVERKLGVELIEQ
ncbi:MAG: hypothetical protein JWP55_1636 [Mycobacterium sp.]|nr:hypothetical protein [Mycobacterium sp.]